MTTQIKSASALYEPEIRVVAPFYGVKNSSGLAWELGKDVIGSAKHLNFPSSYTPKMLDPDTGAKWEPFDLGPGTEHWYYGQITIDQDHVGDYFYDYEFDETHEDLIPDMFVWGELIVTEKARDILAAFAPDHCYFSPVKFLGKQSGRPAKKALFKTYVRRSLTYRGPIQNPRLYPHDFTTIVRPDTWTSFCKNPSIVQVAKEQPIFLFDRMQKYPVLRADVFKALKKVEVTGLLEATFDNESTPSRPDEFYDFETVFPLDPRLSASARIKGPNKTAIKPLWRLTKYLKHRSSSNALKSLISGSVR